MLSRVAEQIYWLNRYVERAENVARVVDVNLHLELDLPQLEEYAAGNQWQPLIWATGDEKAFETRYKNDFSRENVMHFLTFDMENPNSIISCIKAARENARSVREVISSDMWYTLNRFYLQVRDPLAAQNATRDPHVFYTEIKRACALFIGETITTMSHGEGFHFARIGRLLERGDKTSRILDVKYYILLPKLEYVGMPIDSLQWAALLKSASALEMYRKSNSTITPKYVSRFLLLDREFPRAVLHCLTAAETSLRAITGTAGDTISNAAEQKLGQLRADLNYANIDDIIQTGLHEYIDSLQTRLNQIDDSMYRTFFEVRSDVMLQSQSQSQS